MPKRKNGEQETITILKKLGKENDDNYCDDTSYNRILVRTMYGDTDDYGFVGVVFESVTLKKDPVQQESRSNNLKVELTIFKGQKYYKILKSEEESFLIPYKQGMSKQDAIRIYNNSFL